MATGRIIVAEDDPEQARLLKLHLTSDGHTVFVAGDGLQALDEIRRRGPDLVLLDVMMPKLDGLDVCRLIRQEPDVPIIMITARSTEDDVLLGLELSADDGTSDSFYVTIDGTPANGYLWDVNQNTSYAADHISDRGGPDPIEIQLTAGQHTIDIHGREPDTRLDTITLETTP
jgi:CheY-like chemotaxis protein